MTHAKDTREGDPRASQFYSMLGEYIIDLRRIKAAAKANLKFPEKTRNEKLQEVAQHMRGVGGQHLAKSALLGKGLAPPNEETKK